MNLEELRKHKPAIQNLAKLYKIDPNTIRVFGSVARGESSENSDVDLLVKTLPNCGLFDLGGIYADLTDLLHCKVDVVPDDSIRPRIAQYILKDAILL
ncbi:MAG: nucleotidyltransferase family protein [Rickettsiales bacterium]